MTRAIRVASTGGPEVLSWEEVALTDPGEGEVRLRHFDIATLAAKGSLYLTRPTLFTYVASRDELEDCASALIDVVSSGAVRIEVNQSFLLSEAVDAHRALEARATTGSTVLIP